METEVGRQMTAALSAVRKMHFDCSRLLRDIDKEFDGYRSVYASIATTDLSYDVKTGLYMAEVCCVITRKTSPRAKLSQ